MASSSLLLDFFSGDPSPPPSSIEEEKGEEIPVSGTPVHDQRMRKERTSEVITCPECDQTFSKPGNRNKHIRAIHGMEPDLKTVEKREKGCRECGLLFASTNQYTRHRKEEHGSLFCPIPGCIWRGSSHRGLGRHAAEMHAEGGKDFQWRTNHFPSQLQFSQFIREMYEKGHLWYIRNGSNSSIEERIEYRYCHREDRRGTERKMPPRKRKGKKGKKREQGPPTRMVGLARSEACCTSYMRVRWRRDGRVETEYCIDHLGHETEGASLPLLPEHKEEIREVLQMEDDPEEVVRRLREKYEYTGGRLATVEEEDVREVMREEVDPFGEMEGIKEEEGEGTDGGTACITMEFSPSGPCEEGTDASSALLALLDGHTARDDSAITLGQLVASAQTQSSAIGSKRKTPRFKLTDNGFVFRFDKNSVCGERQFWRCERKNECAARVHTDMKGTIVKRINYHTHPSNPNPEQVYLPKKKARMSPSDHSMDHTEGLLHPSTQPTDHCGDNGQDYSHMENGAIDGLLDAFVKEEDMGNLNEAMHSSGEETGIGPSELISPSMQNGNELERTGMGMSEDFWRVFHLTKKVYGIVKKELQQQRNSSAENELVDEEVMNFLREHRMDRFASKLRRYSKRELRMLSVDECKEVLDDVAEGVRMHHAIRSEWGESNLDEYSGQNGMEKQISPSLPSIRLYLATAEESTPVYKMVTLPEGRRTLHSLREGLTRRGVLAENDGTIICVNEGRFTVELCDEMMDEWTEDRVFRYQRSGEYFVLQPSQEM